MTVGSCTNEICSDKKASTANSSATFKVAVAQGPNLKAISAKPKQGNKSLLGDSKFSALISNKFSRFTVGIAPQWCG